MKHIWSNKKRQSHGFWFTCLFSLVIIFTWRSLVYAGSNDALLIDESGKVEVQELEVKSDVNVGGTLKARKFEGDGSGMTGLTAKQHNGKQAGPGLFEVHTRVLWDLGWLKDSAKLVNGAYFAYNESPKDIVYGKNQTLILSPLKGYGVPDIPDGATRKVRLYVTYSHQWMCNGKAVTVRIGGVDFDLPLIHGAWIHPAAGWSNSRQFSEYQQVGHSAMQVFLKDYVWVGNQCQKAAGSNRGAIYRIEAHFYDEYPE
jgi:hypothetical protein